MEINEIMSLQSLRVAQHPRLACNRAMDVLEVAVTDDHKEMRRRVRLWMDVFRQAKMSTFNPTPIDEDLLKHICEVCSVVVF